MTTTPAMPEFEKELTSDELQLYKLALEAGLPMNVKAFKAIMGLQKLNISPVNITRMLQELVNIREGEKRKRGR